TSSSCATSAACRSPRRRRSSASLHGRPIDSGPTPAPGSTGRCRAPGATRTGAEFRVVIPVGIAHYLAEALGQTVRQERSAMTERTIFLNALDRTDLAARAAYLDAACAGRPELRQRIEELLRSHQEVDTFLQVPAVQQLADAEQSLAFL